MYIEPALAALKTAMNPAILDLAHAAVTLDTADSGDR